MGAVTMQDAHAQDTIEAVGIQQTSDPDGVGQTASVHFVEQPSSDKARFLGLCMEPLLLAPGNRTIKGQHSTPVKETFPKIQILGYNGPAVVVVSCVTHDTLPPRAHPHRLVWSAGCKGGVCSISVTNEDMTVEFPNLVIQCVRRKGIAEALRQRQEMSVDPYRQGFDHANNPETIAMDAVKLCFGCFLRIQRHLVHTLS